MIYLYETPEYRNSLTERELAVEKAEKDFLIGHNDAERAAKIGLTPSQYSKAKLSKQGKFWKYARREKVEKSSI